VSLEAAGGDPDGGRRFVGFLILLLLAVIAILALWKWHPEALTP